MAFAAATPGFTALFVGSQGPDKLAPSAQQVYKAILTQFDDLLATAAPALPPDRRYRCAQVTVQVIKSLLPLLSGAAPAEQAALVAELKAVVAGYLGPLREASGHA
jgi:hypothetical protein